MAVISTPNVKQKQIYKIKGLGNHRLTIDNVGMTIEFEKEKDYTVATDDVRIRDALIKNGAVELS